MPLPGYEETQIIVERVILMLGDMFNLQVEWHGPLLIGGGAVAGGSAGFWFGPLGAVAGAAVGAVGGFGVSRMVSLRRVWNYLRDTSGELLHIVADYLRRLDPDDINRAVQLLIKDTTHRGALVRIIRDFIVGRLIRVVIANFEN